MKRLCLKKTNTKRGVASLYVVIFATMLFGVVTLSFIRIVINQAGRSSDDDLSRSAYDSAMAGVEDAKTAVNRYYACMSSDNPNKGDCGRSKLFKEDCDTKIGLAEYLYGSETGGGYDGGELLLSEKVTVADETAADQAYTCVIISDSVPDYRGTLSKDTRTKVIPLRVAGSALSSGNTISKVNIKWYSALNQGDKKLQNAGNDYGRVYESDDVKLHPNGERTIPPTISVSFIRVQGDMVIDNFHQASNHKTPSGDDYDLIYSSMTIVPNTIIPGNPSAEISSSQWTQFGNVNSPEAVAAHEPIAATCSSTSEFACQATLLDTNIGSNDTAFLVISLPYEETISDFAIELLDASGKVVEFDGAQISVDSTGRTSQLVRRVETRLDPADLYFPYPQYAIEAAGGDDGDAIKKYFWITNNCWYSQPTKSVAGACDNNGSI